jgi:arginine/lysine/ornithine decarboxylase
VDAAWAAHFGFHPDLPRHGLQLGADVVVTSAHKTLPAVSQAALILARTDRVDPGRLDAGVEATATTSPAGSILASIDAARACWNGTVPSCSARLSRQYARRVTCSPPSTASWCWTGPAWTPSS